MNETPAPSSKRLILPMLAAALLGGGVAAGVTAAVDGGGGDAHTTTVIRQPAVAASGANRESVNGGLTAADIYQRYAPGVVFIRSEIVQQSDNPFGPFGGEQRSEATGSGFVIDKA